MVCPRRCDSANCSFVNCSGGVSCAALCAGSLAVVAGGPLVDPVFSCCGWGSDLCVSLVLTAGVCARGGEGRGKYDGEDFLVATG